MSSLDSARPEMCANPPPLYPDLITQSPLPSAPPMPASQQVYYQSPPSQPLELKEHETQVVNIPKRGLISRIWHWITEPVGNIFTINSQAKKIETLGTELKKAAELNAQLVSFNDQLKRERDDTAKAFEMLNKRYMSELGDVTKIREENEKLTAIKQRLEYELSLAIQERDSARIEFENAKKTRDDHAERVHAERERSMQATIDSLSAQVQKQSAIISSRETTLLKKEQKISELQSQITGLLDSLSKFELSRKQLDSSLQQESVARTQLLELLSKVSADRSSVQEKKSTPVSP